MSTPSERLKKERIRLGYSQTAFAALGGVQKRTQINYEKGERKPDAAYLRGIASVGADIGYILTGNPDAVREVLADIKSTTELAAALGGDTQEIAANQAVLFKGVREARVQRADQEELLRNYESCTQEDREVLKQMARRLAQSNALDVPKSKQKRAKP